MKRLNKIIWLIIPLVIISGLNLLDIIDLSSINDHHFDIITINAVFAGFLFSSLSLILGLGKDRVAVLLERMETTDKIYHIISVGIICNFLSIVFALINIFTQNVYSPFIHVIEVAALISSMVYFMRAVRYVKLIIRMLRSEIRKQMPSEEIVISAIQKLPPESERKILRRA